MEEYTNFVKNLKLAMHPDLIKQMLQNASSPPSPEAPVEEPKLPAFEWPPTLLQLPDILGNTNRNTETMVELLRALQPLPDLLNQQLVQSDLQLGALAAQISLLNRPVENLVTVRDQDQLRTYDVQKAFLVTIGPVTIGAGVTLTLNAAPITGTFAITKALIDCATNTAGLVTASILVNADTPFQWQNVPIPVYWPTRVIDLRQMGGIRVIPGTTQTTLGVTFVNSSAIQHQVACTFYLEWLEEQPNDDPAEV